MAEQAEQVEHDRSRRLIRTIYIDTLITETITTFIMLCWKYDNSKLAIYVLISFLNCITFRACVSKWTLTTTAISVIINVYGSSSVFVTTEWNILSLFCLILVMINFWIPLCRFAQVALVILLAKCLNMCIDIINAPSARRMRHNEQILRRMLTHIHTNDETCSICTDEFNMGEESRKLPCGHVFHPACIDKWIASGKETCPNCRHNINEQPQANV